MTSPDWKAAELRLVEESTRAIQAFAAEHGDVECCYFAFDFEPRYGYVLLCFDTTANSRASARKMETIAIEGRQRMFSKDDSWKHAKYFLTTPVLAPFGDDTGCFAFIGYREVNFPDWNTFAESEDYPAQQKNEDDLLDGHFRILIWKVIERLFEQRAFDCLGKSSPFIIGYGIHDQEMSIVRMIWTNEESST